MALIDETRIVKEALGKPLPGNYAVQPLPERSLEWISCRDRFAMIFNELLDGFYFSHDGERIQTAKFIEKVESILQLPSFSNFQPTNRDYITWVTPAPFWKQSFIRRSLFTLLLRLGASYVPEKDNFEEALYSHNYMRETKWAVMRFLFGFTVFNVDRWDMGWVSTFSHKSLEEIRTRLSSPNEKEASLIGLGSVWR